MEIILLVKVHLIFKSKNLETKNVGTIHNFVKLWVYP